MSGRRYLRNRDFFGEEFYAFTQKNFDEARNYLKNCGKPETEEDKFWIQEMKWKANHYGRML